MSLNQNLVGSLSFFIISSALLYFQYSRYKKDDFKDDDLKNPYFQSFSYFKTIVILVLIVIISFLGLLFNIF